MRILLLLLFFKFSFGQINGIVKDSKTRLPISYVNIGVENKEVGVSANEKGEFVLVGANQNDVLIFSAVGYQSLKIKQSDIKEEVFLEERIFDLMELAVNPRKGKKIYQLGNIDRKEINSFFANRGYPHINGRYIPFTENISATRYLKEIRFLTRSKIRNAIFNIRLLTLNDNGNPIEYYSEQNIIGQCKKGMSITKINVENLNIKFPETGLIVGVEWILIDRNKYVSEYWEKGKKQKSKKTEYSPWFGGDMEIENNSWTKTSNLSWYKQIAYSFDQPIGSKGKYSTLAVELLLTD
jgi:hypothetical protein